MARTVYATCPMCRGLLEVNTENGKVVRHFTPREVSESGDAIADVLKEIREGEASREEKFRSAREQERDKLERLEKEFFEKKKEVKDSGDISRPLRDIDLD